MNPNDSGDPLAFPLPPPVDHGFNLSSEICVKYCQLIISLQDLIGLVHSTKTSSCPIAILLACLVLIINGSLQSGCVPAYFKMQLIRLS